MGCGINVSCSRTQHNDTGETPTCNPSVLSQALYHRASALPLAIIYKHNEFLPMVFGYREGTFPHLANIY